jgi:hypothetical protein
MKITREQATAILLYLRDNPNYFFPYEVMCQEVDQDNREEDDTDFVGLCPEDLDEEDNDLPERYQTFELRADDVKAPRSKIAFQMVKLLLHAELDDAMSEYKKIHLHVLQYNELPDIDSDTDLFEYGYLRGIEKALTLMGVDLSLNKNQS